jgi:sugar lactone lactonase YvrE
LEFAPPFSNGEGASLVIGQPSFTVGACLGVSQTGLCRPAGLAFDSLGQLWVTDQLNSRVLEFTPPFSIGESASLVIGQPGFTTGTCSGGLGGTPTQSGLCLSFGGVLSSGVAFDSSGNLWATDDFNSRMLEFKPPFSSGESASLVIGQSSFTTNTCSTTQSGLCGPSGLAFDSSGNLWVPDEGNSRVLEFTKVAPPADFSASAGPSSLSIKRGTSTTVGITLASVNGFMGKVDLTATIAPLTQTSPAVVFSAASLNLLSGGTAISTLIITAVHTPKGDGNYVITVMATSGSITHTVTISLTVTKT